MSDEHAFKKGDVVECIEPSPKGGLHPKDYHVTRVDSDGFLVLAELGSHLAWHPRRFRQADGAK